MITTIQKWGNSQGLRFSKQILDEAHIRIGDPVEVKIENGIIFVKPAKAARKKHDLKKLIARMPKKYKLTEDWDEPAGKEVW